jgi:hypothetical protein
MYIVRSHVKLMLGTTVASLLCLFLGCSLPNIPADDTYEVLGGIVQREHPSLGRANSAFEINQSELATEMESVQTAPMLPSILKDPEPLEPLKHSPIIP